MRTMDATAVDGRAETGLLIAEGLRLPLEVVTQATAILAKRRAGKSYTARKLVEEVVGAGQQVVVVDPKGDWWGLRASADGRGPGLSIAILGGEHGDVPLDAGAGEAVARFLVEQRLTCLLDLSELRKHEVATFMAAFLETLYRLKAKERYRTPLLLTIDEADAIAPQVPQRGEERMLGAAEDIVRRGGQRGIGCVLVTQRSAVLNKNVLTQAGMIVALRTIAPQDLKALAAWIDVHGTPEGREALMASLPSLPVGTAWFWAPGWPTDEGIFRRAAVLPVATFDSGATPRPGTTMDERPTTLAEVDLTALRYSLAAAIEAAERDDPRALRLKVGALEGRTRGLEAAMREQGARHERNESDLQTVLDDWRARALSAEERLAASSTAIPPAAAARLATLAEGLQRAAMDIASGLSVLDAAPLAVRDILQEHGVGQGVLAGDEPNLRSGAERGVGGGAGRDAAADGRLRAGERRMLTILAQWPAGLTRQQLATLSGFAESGGTFGTYLGVLKRRGLAVEMQGRVAIADDGRLVVGPSAPAPLTREAVLERWRGALRAGERKMLDLLIDAHRQGMSRKQLAEESGFALEGGTFGTYLGVLRRNGLAEEANGRVFAGEALFLV
jgi:uncharacterized protein